MMFTQEQQRKLLEKVEGKYSKLANFFTLNFYANADSLNTQAEIIEQYFYEVDSDDIVANTITEFDELIKADYAEEELEFIVNSYLHNGIAIDNDDWQPTSHTYKEWIVDLRNILQAELDRRLNESSTNPT